MIKYRVRVKYFLKKREGQKRRASKQEWVAIEAVPDSGDDAWRLIARALARAALRHIHGDIAEDVRIVQVEEWQDGWD